MAPWFLVGRVDDITVWGQGICMPRGWPGTDMLSAVSVARCDKRESRMACFGFPGEIGVALSGFLEKRGIALSGPASNRSILSPEDGSASRSRVPRSASA